MPTERQTKNTVLVLVMLMPDVKEEATMSDELFRRILLYKTTMATIKKMLENGLITPEEYAIIDTKIAEKYALNSSVIYR